MPDRITRVTTTTGDGGSTSLADGTRYNKDHAFIDLVGALDEANCAIGLCTTLIPPAFKDLLLSVQSRIFDVGAAVALGQSPHDWLKQTSDLQNTIADLNGKLEPLKEFVLPGSNEINARLHFARALVRRAEREFWRADLQNLINVGVGAYLNRLSDLLFVLARTVSATELLWQPLQTNTQ